MDNSKVYFIDFHTTPKQNILKKLSKLLIKAGIKELDMQKKMVALKIHFGEPGNMSYIRPNYVAVIVKQVMEQGGMPFLTDSNTLYKGLRSNAYDHLKSAMENGFTPLTTGCNVIIADGIKGTDYREVEIDQKNCRSAKIGAAIADADVVISVTHFKGHEMTGFGGALKNLGMGSGSVGGKLVMHSDEKPVIIRENCTSCGVCVKNCAHDAIHLDKDHIASINYDNCVGCGQCIAVCQYGAPQSKNNSGSLQEKIAEYALAVLKDKPAFHVSFIMDVSPLCDCWGFNDVPVVPNIGILASTDPVALDRACVDLVNKAPVFKNCVIGHLDTEDKDRFTLVAPSTDWKFGLAYAEEIGLGTQKYEMITVE